MSALCPGAVRTALLTGSAHGHSIYSIKDDRMLDWWRRLGPIMELDDFTREALLARNEPLVVLPKRHLALLAFVQVLPDSVAEKVMRKLFENTLRDFPEIAQGRARPVAFQDEPPTRTRAAS